MRSLLLTDLFIESLIKEKFTCAMNLLSIGSIEWCKKKLLEIRLMRQKTQFYKTI